MKTNKLKQLSEETDKAERKRLVREILTEWDWEGMAEELNLKTMGKTEAEIFRIWQNQAMRNIGGMDAIVETEDLPPAPEEYIDALAGLYDCQVNWRDSLPPDDFVVDGPHKQKRKDCRAALSEKWREITPTEGRQNEND
ncbi:MAG: hypothetical protein GY841_16385 [FCB group bacterium]|nr:hypothetical protein [FCB group bacterium]